LRENRNRCQPKILQQVEGNDGFQLQNGRCNAESNRCVVAQMAIGTIRIFGRDAVVPVADHAGHEDQQRGQRQKYSENANRLSHAVSDCNPFARLATRRLPWQPFRKEQG